MINVKNIISKLSVEVKELFQKFPITLLLIIVETSIITFSIDENVSDFLEKLMLFIVIWGIGTFFTEICFRKKVYKIISYFLTGGIAYTFAQILLSNTSESVWYPKILATYIIVLFFTAIFKILKNENLMLKEYILKLFRNLLNTSIVYGILSIGISILLVIFVQLILDGKYGENFLKIHTLLFGLYYVPSILYSVALINKTELNIFTKNLVLRVLLPLVVIAMFIIYIYIAKIIILRNMPKNIIFRILAGIFIFAFPIWNMADYYSEEKNVIRKIVKILPILYTPFILLEIYSIGRRISEFGITPNRYACIAFIVFQIICLVLTFFKKKEKLEYIFIIIPIMAAICLITPLSYDHISIISQTNQITKILNQTNDFDNLDDEQKSKLKGAYRYLKDSDNAEFPEELTEEIQNKLDNYYKFSDVRYDEYEYNFYGTKELNLNLKGYTNIQKVSVYDSREKITLDEINQKIDLSFLIEKIIENLKISEDSADQYYS